MHTCVSSLLPKIGFLSNWVGFLSISVPLRIPNHYLMFLQKRLKHFLPNESGSSRKVLGEDKYRIASRAERKVQIVMPQEGTTQRASEFKDGGYKVINRPGSGQHSNVWLAYDIRLVSRAINPSLSRLIEMIAMLR